MSNNFQAKYDFNGKTAIISGGTSGIGLATAKIMLLNKANVIITGRDPERGQSARETLAAISGNVQYVQADVCVGTSRDNVIRESLRYFGQIDILVNSAGQYLEKLFEHMSENEYDELMNLNSKATYFMCQAALPELRQQNGCIINIASDAGLNGNAQCSAYCASKGAVVLFTKALALECAPYSVRVNCVCPADVLTPLFDRQFPQPADNAGYQALKNLYPLGRIAEADEVAHVICFLASGAASFVTGAAWTVDGGITAY